MGCISWLPPENLQLIANSDGPGSRTVFAGVIVTVIAGVCRAPLGGRRPQHADPFSGWIQLSPRTLITFEGLPGSRQGCGCC
jgi:hypothetical protein